MGSPGNIKLFTFLLILITIIFFAPADAYAKVGFDAEKEGQNILEEKLKSNEIKSIKKAVDQALKGNDISEAYDFSSDKLLKDALKGTPMNDISLLPDIVIMLLGKELKANIALVLQLIAVMLLGSIINALQPFESGLSNQAAKLAVNGVIIVIASVSFGNMIKIGMDTISSMQEIVSLAIPALIALMASAGRIASVTAIQPLMLVGVNVVCQLLKTVFLPLAIISGILFLIDGLSERFNLKTLAKLFKSFTVWMTGIITMAFSIGIQLQKAAGSSIDEVTLKTTKFALGTFIPVTGKYMADAAETLLLYTTAASNAAGILTVIGLGLVFISPFIKIFVIMISLKLAAAFGAPLCDECICEAINEAAGCLSVIIGIIGASMFMLMLITGSLMGAGGIIK